jgi:hypothetical protein
MPLRAVPRTFPAVVSTTAPIEGLTNSAASVARRLVAARAPATIPQVSFSNLRRGYERLDELDPFIGPPLKYCKLLYNIDNCPDFRNRSRESASLTVSEQSHPDG